MGRQSHATKRSRDQGLIRGIKKHPETFHRIGVLDRAAVVKLLQEHLDALDMLEEAASHHAACVKRERALERRVRAISPDLKSVVHVSWGNDAIKLLDFGLVPYRKTGPKTPEVIKDAIAKAKATRAARHTMGKRQREAIRGTSGGG